MEQKSCPWIIPFPSERNIKWSEISFYCSLCKPSWRSNFHNSDKSHPQCIKGTIQPCDPWLNRTGVPSESFHAKTTILYYTHTDISYDPSLPSLALFSCFSLFTVNIKIIQIKKRGNGPMWCLPFSRVTFRSFSYL